MLIQVVIRLIVYTDQFVSRQGNGAIGQVKVRRSAAAAASAAAVSEPSAAASAPTPDGAGIDLIRGIDNTVSTGALSQP